MATQVGFIGLGHWRAADRRILGDLDALGFGGAVGLEYKPQGSAEESFAWLPREARG